MITVRNCVRRQGAYTFPSRWTSGRITSSGHSSPSWVGAPRALNTGCEFRLELIDTKIEIDILRVQHLSEAAMSAHHRCIGFCPLRAILETKGLSRVFEPR